MCGGKMADDDDDDFSVLDYMRGEGATPFQETARSSPSQAFVLLPCCYGSGAEPCASLSRGGREDHFGLALNRGRELSLSRWLLERPLEASLPSLPPGGSGGGGGGGGGGRPDAAAAAAVPAAPALSTSATMSSSSLVACNTNCSGSGRRSGAGVSVGRQAEQDHFARRESVPPRVTGQRSSLP